ncbi:DUF423 domain-containing protein [Mycoplana dimorpha]|uniref:Uncharacterized membrane protein YgdD (TMEM256/DUF423 family) n=1 Tax=Mycoplana dimorpha TaxID=28320 RepID=A0A2T5B1D0_MYCDI|nr:DUF423 domain-containing protein [Mycoplana dimorpha]PTM92781.1 uncharacterized membrane protein YgdD (TMEM256/DUF423 family) [Mycoplana dimorpha]
MNNSLGRAATLFFAGILGVAGVASAALASHASGDPRLMGGASAMCLAHAPALVGLYAAWPTLRTAAVAALLLIVGTLLFAGDLALRHFAGHGLFAMSAPAGGLLMMAGWLTIAAGAFMPRRQA